MSRGRQLREKLKITPESPGVYLLKDSKRRIIYVGKAKNLRERVGAYLRDGGDTRFQIELLKKILIDFEYIVTRNEKESLILENELIKKYRPRFNVRLRDDKSYVNIRISKDHPFPRIHIVRRPALDGSVIFGPYSSAKAARKTLKLLLRAFPMRSCADDEFKRRTRPCILYQIKQSSAPCVNYISKEDYGVLVKGMIAFLRGKNRSVMDSLRREMEALSAQERFEEAAEARDRLMALEKTVENQRIVSNEPIDRDVFAVAGQSESYSIAVLNIRQGVLQNVSTFFFKKYIFAPEELLETTVSQYYDNGNFVPEEVILEKEIQGIGILAGRLSELKGERVQIIVPQRGEKADLLKLARINAESALKQRLDSQEDIERVMEELKIRFALPRPPETIEAIDISNISGREAVGAKVAFVKGKPEKSLYRRYRVRTVEGVDDYGMMREVMLRRIEAGKRDKDLPDLLMVDGGKGHLSVVKDLLREMCVNNVSVLGIAKPGRKDYKSYQTKKYEDHFYIPGRSNPVFLKKGSRPLLLLKRIRDEAHRFAIRYHRILRRNRVIESELDRIPGIGAQRKQALLRAFGSIEMLRKASIEQLHAVGGINRRVAGVLYSALHEGKSGLKHPE